jgi:hypothetical protein
VTYVHIYSATPTTVVCGYTSGYHGEVVSNGVVMFGLGIGVGLIIANNYDHFYYPPYYWGYGPRPYPYYGHYHYAAGPHGYAWSAHGPYGGYGYGAHYNPATGTYRRAGYAYGPGGGAGYRTAYNPRTGNAAAQRGGYNAYGSWKQTAVKSGDDWARGGQMHNAQGDAGGFRTSSGAAGIAGRTDHGSGYVVKGKDGNIYAGKDGNVYRKDTNGGWESRDHSQWSPASSKAPARPAAAPPSTRPANAPSGTNTRFDSGGNTGDRLNYDARARQSGNSRATKSTSMKSGGARGR